MGFLNKYIVLSLFMLGVPTLIHADELRLKISQMEKEIQSQESSIDASRIELAEMTQEIQTIKKNSGFQIVSKILLQKKCVMLKPYLSI